MRYLRGRRYWPVEEMEWRVLGFPPVGRGTGMRDSTWESTALVIGEWQMDLCQPAGLQSFLTFTQSPVVCS